jgi:outer membrane protein OmpA-like peptidoglycan-associated protein
MTRIMRARGLASTIAAFGFCAAMSGAAFGKTLPTALSRSVPQGYAVADPLVDVAKTGQGAKASLEAARAEFEIGKLRRSRQILRGLVIRFPSSPEAAEARKLLRRILATLVANAPRSSLGVTREPDGASKLGGASVPLITEWRIQVTKGATLQDALALTAGDRVFFAPGSTVLDAGADAVVAAQAQWLKEHPRFGLVITGHSDEPLSEADNIVLSVERAKAVRARLVEQGIAKERLRVAGFGNAKPVAVCKFQACLAQNRRVVAKVARWSRRNGLHQLSSR